MKPFTDDSKMPFGKYKGVPMKKVPADWFFWLWTKAGYEKKTEVDPVANYIKRNLSTLKQDHPDGIWE